MMEKRHNHVRNGIIVSLLLCAVFFLVAKTQTPGPTMLRSSASEVGPLSQPWQPHLTLALAQLPL